MFPTFEDFHTDVFGYAPFPWQTNLATHVATHGWPTRVNIPTGLGKTGTITIAIYELARQTYHGGRRTAPLRTFHVVDRRTVVDQAYATVQTIAAAFARQTGPARRVADVLTAKFGTALVCDRIHGAINTDQQWVRIDAPTVVSMTAHQFVSRLLFRGFGVSPSMSPIHAALTGVDRLVLFDEPHLSAPAVQTITAQQTLHGQYPSIGVPPGTVVTLGATLPQQLAPGPAATLTHEDLLNPEAHRRLTARRPLTIRGPKTARDDEKIAALIVRLATELARDHDNIGIIVNTVAFARRIHQMIRDQTGESDTLLVTSYIRGADRDAINRTLAQHMPRYTVSTQALEAGPDISFDGLITEACPWPALLQRIGRANRYGLAPHATIYYIQTIRRGTKAVYEKEAVQATCDFLTSLGRDQIDMSLTAQQEMTAPSAAKGSLPKAATLHRGLFPTLTHTRPRPSNDIPLPAFITGQIDEAETEDIQVAWRHDCTPEALTANPIRALETVAVPIPAVRALLSDNRTAVPALSDSTQAARLPETPSTTAITGKAMRRGKDGWEPITTPAHVTPGSTVVIDTRYGGYDTMWAPESTAEVTDLSPALALRDNGWLPLTRESLTHLSRVTGTPDANTIEAFMDALDAATDLDDGTVTSLINTHLVAPLTAAAEAVGNTDLASTAVITLGDAVNNHPMLQLAPPYAAINNGRISLTDHAAQVAHQASVLADHVALDAAHTETVKYGAYHHDDGKEHPPNQAAFGAPPGTILAKSGHERATYAEQRRRLDEAGVERNWRHEALSAKKALATGAPDLAVHLIASHHGWSRPLLPPSNGPGHDTRADTARFHRLNDDLGPWNLAYLETIVRLADHQASAEPQTGLAPPTIASYTDRRTDRSQPAAMGDEHRLTGYALDSPLSWWAALGFLAAATHHDPSATVRYDDTDGVFTPTLTTTVAMETLCREIAQLTTPPTALLNKNQNASLTDLEHLLANLDLANLDGRLLAAACSDAYLPHQRKKKKEQKDQNEPKDLVRLCTPWLHNNSNGFKTAAKALTARPYRDILTLLHETCNTTRAANQYTTNGNSHGFHEAQVNRAGVHGIQPTHRTIAFPPAVYALTAVSNDGKNTLGVTRDGMMLPVPHEDTDLARMVAFMRTIPALPGRDWSLAGCRWTVHFTKTALDEHFAYYALTNVTDHSARSRL